VDIRVRWSKFLDAKLQVIRPTAAASRSAGGSARASAGRSAGTSASPSASPSRPREITAKVVDDGSGWTKITTTRPGDYVLSGSLGGITR
jgi:hypothetical protein